MEKYIKFLKNSDDKMVFISKNKDLLSDINESNSFFVLIDNVETLDYVSLEYIFSKNKIVIFINDIFNQKQFNDIVTDKLIRYFDFNNNIHDSIIYSSYDFIDKGNLFKVSSLSKESAFNNSSVKNILYLAQSGTSGYATASKGYICDYYLKNNNVRWKPLYFDNSKNDSSYYVDVIAESCKLNKYDYYDLFILHSTPDIWKREMNIHKKLNIKKTVGYCTWETSKLPTDWVTVINKLEEVWVPSYFNKDSFINSGVYSKIKVVPHIWHKQELFNKSDITIHDYFGNQIPKGKYTFYSIGELNHRKGIEDLVSVFNKLANTRQDVQLILKLHYKQYNNLNYYKCIKQIKNITDKLGTSIYLILDNLSNRELLMLHSFGDCYVSLNKGEGFGLTIFDAMNFDKDIITTKYGGPLDYIRNRRQLVPCEIKNVTGMDSFSKQYTEDQEWAYPDLECAYEMMLAKVS